MSAAFFSGNNGWVDGVVHRSSPHFNARPAGMPVTLAVIHYISLPAGVFGGDDTDALFMGTLDTRSRPEYADLAGLRVSSHFFIRRTGEVRQYVSVFNRAWHAGISSFEGRADCNNYSVGIELEGTGEVPFEAGQYEALTALLETLLGILPLQTVTGHEFIAPGRKSDPGPFFDWTRLSRMLPTPLRTVTVPQTF